jgi:hypothetical protein
LVNDDISCGRYGFLQKQKWRMVCLEMFGKCQFVRQGLYAKLSIMEA